ncbi:perlucin-like [Mercenaria mercenaria]|uniref:perlucin-like n=1 Tax=Mercenaria mercenaria TaxID=6596 RepID=UPI00234EFF82|nr:perlucin-like [Mercenaria mercenaria]
MSRFVYVMCLFIFIRPGFSEMFSKHFKIVPGKTVNGMAPQSGAVTTAQCISQCLQEKTCIAVVHHSTSQNCYLLSSTGSLVQTNDLGCTYIYVGGGCMDGWVEYGGSCYLFSYDTYSWTDARVYCNNFGAELVEIETSSENVFVRETLESIGHSKYWIGLNDLDTEGVWVWTSTGIQASYLGWEPTQPNNGVISNCGAIWRMFDYKWVDEWCTSLFHPICEQDATSTNRQAELDLELTTTIYPSV